MHKFFTTDKQLSMILTSDQLRKIVPLIKPASVEAYMPYLSTVLPKYEIDTPQRIAGFIAQVAEESINFSYTLERDTGEQYEMNAALGNTIPGEGKLYKGRGLIQITGKANYYNCSMHIFGDERLLKHPELLQGPEYAVTSACWYWKDRELNAVCDQPEDYVHTGIHHYTKIQWMTVKINGGLNGIAIRLANYQRAKQVFNF